MKKIVSFLLATVMLLSFSNCSDEDFDAKYRDPSTIAEPTIPGLFTGVLRRCLDYSNYGYSRFFAVDRQFFGYFSQTWGFTGSYEPGFSGYVNSLMGSYYYAMTDYVKLLELYNAMGEDLRKQYDPFRYGAMVHLYDYLLSTVDMYGNIPFSEACTLPATGDIVASYAPYDKAEDIYSTVLDDLKTAADVFIDLVSKPGDVHQGFAAYDFLNTGSPLKWALYTNSLRLRAAIRSAQHGPITAKAQAAIKEILENPAKYPILETNELDEMIFLKNDHSDALNWEGGGGLGEWSNGKSASGAIVNRMLSNGNWRRTVVGDKDVHVPNTGRYIPDVDDPRILLLYYMRNGERLSSNQYSANDLAVDLTGKWQDSLCFVGVDMSVYRPDPSYYDNVYTSEIMSGGFFWQNKNFEHVQMTAGEALLHKAEAYQRGWGVAKDEAKAKEAFVEGVTKSIELYYHWNEVNNNNTTVAVKIPADEKVKAFAEARWETSVNPAIPYGSAGEPDIHIDAILTQKWLHWGIFFSRQAWAQIRRTGVPKLIYPQASGSVNWAPDRWRYDEGERYYNPYYPGTENDTYYDKLFWADPRGMRRSVYTNGVWSDQYGD
ncbi:MAG: SusD/RagB family nutrient-binding outer membrane lipoprotein [Prevotellaceae bacterium]|jgi:hypothetical protein|nr:SusD/RagB family nutrient-binding outer membrane lipoprotein [Prevotellaceae bacterium]